MTEVQKQTAAFSTQGVINIYANVASVTLSFHDMRIYLAEVKPTEVEIKTIPDKEMKLGQATVSPLACVIINPEFARSLKDALTMAIEKYEGLFGPLRSEPVQQQLSPSTT